MKKYLLGNRFSAHYGQKLKCKKIILNKVLNDLPFGDDFQL